MTDYWKSVGNYFCDFCKTFVRNDAFNRKQHEASERHQNSLKRHVRDLHRKSEREDRDTLRANRELARIGGVVSLPKATQTQRVIPKRAPVASKKQRPVELDAAEEASLYAKQLAVAAMPGEWTTSTVTIIDPDATEVKEEEDQKPEISDESEALLEQDISGEAPARVSILTKRRRDGADEDLIHFQVHERVYEPEKREEQNSDSQPVAFTFKKKKPKPLRKK